MTLIEARGISRSHGNGAARVVALQPTTFNIDAGEFVAILGPSGSGKSTLMNVLGLLDRPSGGQLLVSGVDCAKLPANRLADMRNRQIGFVFQSYQLLPRLDARANVSLPLIYAGVRRRERGLRADAALDSVGMLPKAKRRPSELSGGEQQRIAIARAIVAEPAVILADEPTGALDTATGNDVLQLLCRLHAGGRTIVMVTHDVAIARRATRVLEMRDGRLLSDADQTAPPKRLELVR